MFNVEQILQNADLHDLVSKAGGELGNHGRCACPLHGGNDTNAFAVFKGTTGKELWKCFSGDCGSGDAISFVQKWQGLNFKDACAFLGGDVASDPVAIQASAAARHEAARLERIASQEREQARQRELQKADIHLFYHQTMKQWAVDMWLERGIDESYQALWSLGACDDKVIMFKNIEYRTKTLTIPLFNQQYELLNIKHRLINPPKENDKYRPEREGLGAFPPFLAYPEIGYEGGVIFVIEGEIKAMVTATINPDSTWQFIGVPGKGQYGKLVGQLAGKNVIVIPDPGAEAEALQFTKSVNGRIVRLPDKVDDLINSHQYDAEWLRRLEKQTRKTK